jgi:hypothetical protein
MIKVVRACGGVAHCSQDWLRLLQGKLSRLPAGRNACPTIKHNTRVVLIDPHFAETHLF